jgi:hypothetical protein
MTNDRLRSQICKTPSLVVLLFFVPLCLVSSITQANNPGVSYQGRIFKPDGNPLEGSAVQFKMQIRSPGAENCLLFEEIQSLNMVGSSGVFSITLNDGSGTRLDIPTYQLDRIFANRDTMTLDSNRCTLGTTYLPNTGDGRRLVVYFKDETMADFEPMPTMSLNYAPQAMYALEAQKVDKFGISNILRAVDVSGNPVAAPAFDPTQLGNLNDLIAGTSTQYTPAASFSAVQTFAKTSLPTCGAGQVLKADGTSLSCVTDATGGGGGTVSSVTSANAYLTVATGTTTPDLTLNVGTAANTVAAGNDSRITGALQSGAAAGGSLAGTYPNPTVAAGAITNTEVSASAAIADSKLATISTAGKVSGGAITSGTIGGSTIINTSGNIQTSGVLRVYDGGPTNYVGLKAPASVTTSYDLVFPSGVPASNGYLLSSDTSGTLSWVAPNAGSVTSVTGTAPIASTGGATPVISMSQANTTTAGYISSADWNTFNDKQGTSLPSANILVGNAGGVASAVAPGGDVTMTNAGAFTVTKIRGSTVSATSPTTDGQMLRFNGTQWVPNFISMFDLRSTITGAVTFGAGCTAGQTLTWTSATDNLACTNIAINDSQISNTVSRTANTFLAAPNGSAGVASYRTIASADLPSISSGLTGTLPATNGGTGQSSYTVGDLLYASTTSALSKLPASTSGYVLTSNGAGVAPSWAAAPSSALSGLTPATGTNSINNANYAQTWNWNSATTENPMTLTANALTTGSLLNLTTSSASINSTNGLLNVANTSATTSGILARFQSNSTAGSGMTVLSSGYIGIGTTTPRNLLHLDDQSGSVNPNYVQFTNAQTTNTTNTKGLTIGLWGNSKTATIYQRENADLLFGTKDTERMRIDASGNVGVGTATPGSRLTVNETNVATSGTKNLSDYSLIVLPPSASTAVNQAFQLKAYNNSTGAYDYGTIRGMRIESTFSGATTTSASTVEGIDVVSSAMGGTATNVTGANILAMGSGSPTTTLTRLTGINLTTELDGPASTLNMYGVRSELSTSGTVTSTNRYGFYHNDYNSGTSTNSYGVYIYDDNWGTVTNHYGIFLDTRATATNNWGVYQKVSGAKNYFAGNVGIGTTTPSTSLDLSQKTDAVALPSGTTAQAPVSPIAGEIRYNSSVNAVQTYHGSNSNWGSLPRVIAKYDATAQGANIGAQTLATPTVDTVYRISCIMVLTRAATTSSTLPYCTADYTDADSAVAYSGNLGISGGSTANVVGWQTNQSSQLVIHAKAGIPVSVSTVSYASSGATSMQYAVHVRLEEIPDP